MVFFWGRIGKIKRSQRSILVIRMAGDHLGHGSPKIKMQEHTSFVICQMLKVLYPEGKGLNDLSSIIQIHSVQVTWNWGYFLNWRLAFNPPVPRLVFFCLKSLQYYIVIAVIETVKELILHCSDYGGLRISDFPTQIKLKAQNTLQLQWLGLLLV